ncbi:hypothetical protein MUCCIDRAFT_162950 [Mucor lusitanicus CBS 277.49]|uniref:Uncharacterized protein n=2 Tax=Mucor circinelloides f. lusitanicus TaxID=29924 RepID=A0A168LCZ2_MUCCL|nr:hypothetical protein MUCCIDRAFT_162950 [Mucor lusitanicus CBS 277.49]
MDDADFPGGNGDQQGAIDAMRGERITVVKGSIASINIRRPVYRDRLEHYVNLHHKTTMHTYRLLKYIILHRINNHHFDAMYYLNHRFIHEVYMKLITKARERAPRTQDTIERRAIIDQYLPAYLRLVGINDPRELPLMLNSQQSAMYEAAKISTAYLNNVRNNFGKRLRQVINVLLNVKARQRALRQLLRGQAMDQRAINQAIRRQITNPARRFKIALSNRTTIEALHARFDDGPEGFYTTAIDQLAPFLETYPNNMQFAQDNIYYDCKANPHLHFKAFFRLAELLHQRQVRSFCVFPLRQPFIPGYVIVDTKILMTQIFQRSVRPGEPLRHRHEWGQFIDFRMPIFRAQAGREFGNMIETDGVGVSVLKREQHDLQFQQPRQQGAPQQQEFPYITDPEVQIPPNCVVIDPGRRDMLYCMEENNTPQAPRMFRFTKSMQDKIRKNKRYRRILQQMKPRRIADMERELTNSNTLNLQVYQQYLQNFGRVYEALLLYYSITRGASQTGQFPIHRKLRLSAVINKNRCDQFLIRFLNTKFPNTTTYIMGNWSAPHTRFQEPIRGLGFRRLLQKHDAQTGTTLHMGFLNVFLSATSTETLPPA